MATNPIQALRLRALFEGSNIGENRVTPPVFGADAPPVPQDTTEMAAPQYDELFPTGDINQVRMQNVMQPPAQTQEKEKSLMDIINEHYTPETQDTERFRNLIDSFPERGEPSFGDKLAAAGAYLGNLQRHIPGGPEAAEKVKYAQYNRDLEDWKAQTTPTNQLAQLERTANANERTFAGQIGTAEYNQRKLEQTQKIADTRAEIAQQKADTEQAYRRAQIFKIEHPEWIVNARDTDRVIAYDPTDPTRKLDLGPSGHLSDEKRIELETRGKVQVAQTQAAGREGTYLESGGVIYEIKNGVAVPVTKGAPGTVRTPSGGTTSTGGTNVPAPVGPDGQPQTPPPPQTPELFRDAHKITVQPPPDKLRSIQNLAQETLAILDTEIFDEESLAAYDKSPLTAEEKRKQGIQPKLASDVSARVGGTRQPYAPIWNPYGDQASGDAAIERLKAKLVIDLIGEMKSQSKTGATGFGQLTGPELALLVAAANKLNNLFLDEDTKIIPELVRIREKTLKILLPPDGDRPTVTTTPGTVGANKPFQPPPKGGPASDAAVSAALQQRAAKFLTDNNQPVTPANIVHAIQMGWVK